MAPASLLANWAAEIARFAPSLKALMAHPSAPPAEKLELDGSDDLAGVDLVITSYGFLARAPWLDDHQVAARGARRGPGDQEPGGQADPAVKKLQAETRIALTGTPIENRLGDLWSIFDFINPGLLGSAKQFSTFVKQPRRARRRIHTGRCATWCAPTSCAA